MTAETVRTVLRAAVRVCCCQRLGERSSSIIGACHGAEPKKAVSRRHPRCLNTRSDPGMILTSIAGRSFRLPARKSEIVVVLTPLARASSPCAIPPRSSIASRMRFGHMDYWCHREDRLRKPSADNRTPKPSGRAPLSTSADHPSPKGTGPRSASSGLGPRLPPGLRAWRKRLERPLGASGASGGRRGRWGRARRGQISDINE